MYICTMSADIYAYIVGRHTPCSWFYPMFVGEIPQHETAHCLHCARNEACWVRKFRQSQAAEG